MLKACFFGKFTIMNDNCHWDARESGKAQELLGYLLFHHRKPQTREHLCCQLWPESTAAQAKKYLRQALWVVQSACKTHLALCQGELLQAHHELIQLNPDVRFSSDVASFEQACTHLRTGITPDSDALASLQEAVELYRGNLLEGWQQDWCLYERERLQNLYFILLDKLIVYSETHGDYEAGLNYCTRVLQSDPARERAHQQAMRLHHLKGDRTAALRQFDYCLEALKKELGVRPARQTLTLRDQICADQMEGMTVMTPVLSTTGSPREVFTHLRHLRATLGELEQQLRKDIQLLEQHFSGIEEQ